MPIRNISQLMERSSVSHRRKFLSRCEIYEKVSAFYFHVRVRSRDSLVFYKSNNREITYEDLIINRMWNTPITDFTGMFLKDAEFMEKCQGFKFSFFFFPVSCPLAIDYSDGDGNLGFRYILDRVTPPDDTRGKAVGYIDEFARMDSEGLIRPYGIRVSDGSREPRHKKMIASVSESGDMAALGKLLLDIVDKDRMTSPRGLYEGLVLRDGSEVWQFSNPDFKLPTARNKRLALELFEYSFTSFLRRTEYSDCLVSISYAENVCHLLNSYRKWLQGDKERVWTLGFYNITAEDLESPTFGYYGGTFYDLIPLQSTRELCRADRWWDNAFKILLNGLRKPKREGDERLLLTEDDVRAWNDLVGVMSMYSAVSKAPVMQCLMGLGNGNPNNHRDSLR